LLSPLSAAQAVLFIENILSYLSGGGKAVCGLQAILFSGRTCPEPARFGQKSTQSSKKIPLSASRHRIIEIGNFMEF